MVRFSCFDSTSKLVRNSNGPIETSKPKRVQFVMMSDLVGQVPEDKLYPAIHSVDSEDSDMDARAGPEMAKGLRRKSTSADLVRGRMFDVLFGKNEELSAASLKDKMQQIITQASIEDEKISLEAKQPKVII